MIYRTLGNTGLHGVDLSYGASPLGSVFPRHRRGRGHPHRAHRHRRRREPDRLLALLWHHQGGDGARQGAARDSPRDHYYLATKAGRYGDAEFNFSAARIERSLDESQRRLGVDHVDIFQLHDIEFGRPVEQVIKESLPLLARLKEQGRIGWYGVTGLPLRIFREVLARHPLDTILSYCRYTLNDTSLAALLPDLAAAGVGVINASATGMGLFNPQGVPAWHPAPAPIRNAAAEVVALCAQRGAGATRLALQFALAEPGIHSTLVGTASARNMRANLSCVGEPPDAELLAAAQRLLAPVRNATWPSGRPENN